MLFDIIMKVISYSILGAAIFYDIPQIDNVVTVFFGILVFFAAIAFFGPFTEAGQEVIEKKALERGRYYYYFDLILEMLVVVALAYLGYNFYAIVYGISNLNIIFFAITKQKELRGE